MGHVNIWRKNGTDEHRTFHLPTPPPRSPGSSACWQATQQAQVPRQNTTFPNTQCCVLNHHFQTWDPTHVWMSTNETVRGTREGPSSTKTSVGYCDSGGPALWVLPFPPKVGADFYFPQGKYASANRVLGERMGRVRGGGELK